MLVTVGSTRAPKVEAVRRALAALRPVAPELAAAEIASREVVHGTAPTPLSLEELLRGSRERARRALEALRGEGRPADLGVGLEGGLDVRSEGEGRRAFLMSWAYVTDGRRGAHGCGGAIELPAPLAERVVVEGVELSAAMDALTSQSDTRSRQGAWGILTAGLLDRTRSFELALLNALAPFFNATLYTAGGH